MFSVIDWARWFVLIAILACSCRCDLASQRAAELENPFLVVHRNESTWNKQIGCADTVQIAEGSNKSPLHRSFSQLEVIKSSRNADDEQFVDYSEAVLHFDLDRIRRWPISKTLQIGVIAQVQSSAYSDKFTHRYETFEEIKLANGPAVDNEKCLGQLEQVLNRSRSQELEGLRSTDFGIFHLLDMWDRQSVGFLAGNFFLEGNYEECVKNEVNPSEAINRYCVMKFKFDDWKQIDRHDVVSISAGICIPKSCDSTRYKNKYELIGELAKRHSKGIESDQIKMVDLYCLPDEDSPLRSILQSPKSLVTLVCLSAWVSLLLYATRRHRQLSRSDQVDKDQKDASEQLSSKVEKGRANLFRMLSIENNLKLLFDTSKGSALLESASSKTESQQQTSGNVQGANEKSAEKPAKMDLGCIEGIKVIAMFYIIMGHVLMCMPTIMKNGRALAEQGVYSIAFLTANLVPAFAVNSFFAITGLLTSYLLFKQNEQQRVITSPTKWLAFILFRYLRIMPMYALAVLYCKTLAKYTGSGPLWDYGTSALAQRRACEHEPWSWTLTFTSNLVSPMEHCIPGGWYLSNDFQFFLVTPLYVALLYWRPRFGKAALYASIVAGYLAGFISIYKSDVQDLRPIANFSPSGFKTYVSHLSFNYTHPQYRIPAYLIGLLVGYKMYCLEEERSKFNKLPAEERAGKEAPNWSPVFRQYGAYLISFLIIGCSTTPITAVMIPFNKAVARIMVSLVTPSYHVIFSYLITAFIMLAATGNMDKRLTRFLSASFWKPLARLSLCAVLVNVEVINYIIQGSSRKLHISNSSLMMLNCICITATYIVATVVCCLFEAPIRSALNVMLAQAMKRSSSKLKSH